MKGAKMQSMTCEELGLKALLVGDDVDLYSEQCFQYVDIGRYVATVNDKSTS